MCHTVFIIMLIPYLSLFSACDSTPFQQPTEERTTSKRPSTQPIFNTAAPHDPVSSGWMKGEIAKAWQAFTEGGRYRWAGGNDFRFPEWAKQGYGGLDIERAIRTPIQAGHIKGSYESGEVALIIVDTTRQDWYRYGVVILSEQQKKPGLVEVDWLFRDKDLSRVQLGWSSGDTLGITEYMEDGSYKHCFVKWDARKKRYNCHLKQVR